MNQNDCLLFNLESCCSGLSCWERVGNNNASDIGAYLGMTYKLIMSPFG